MSRKASNPPGLPIRKISADSIAEDLGWESSDRIVAVNGEPVRDPLDFRYLVGDEEVTVEIVKQDGEHILYEIEKDSDDSLGVEFAPIAPDRCGNQCTFCFVHQMPKGMRRSLYIKDEDYRLSFLAGHFTTMATITDAELERIARQRLSPQYISVHATDELLRQRLLGNPKSRPILPTMKAMIAGGVELHTQIVLMHGENDGKNLDHSLEDLIGLYPGVLSIAVVPVGLTAFRDKLPDLQRWDADKARLVQAQVVEWQARCEKKIGENILFLADEFYIMTGTDVPKAEHYGDFVQLGNGVGMIRQFLDGLARIKRKRKKPTPSPLRAHLVSGRTAAGVLAKFAQLANSFPGVELSVLSINNDFFGGDVSCSGLLTGRDIIAQAKHAPPGDLLLPDVLLGETEETSHLLLDDLSAEDIARQTGRRVHVLPHEAEAAWTELCSLGVPSLVSIT